MRTTFLLCAVAAAAALTVVVRADDIETEDINNANFNFIRGSTLCPRELKISGEDSTIEAKEIEADDTKCTGGSVKLRKNPSSGGTALTKALRRIDDRDDSLEGTSTGAIRCGSVTIPSGSYFQFFSPEDEFKVNFASIFGRTSHPLAANSNRAFEFDEDWNYFILGDSCIYKQETRIESSTCFPAEATVERIDGSVVPVSTVAVGDVIRTGPTSFSPVFMFTHKMGDTKHSFVTISTSSGASLSLTKGHYIYADGALVAASKVKVGSTVTLASGATDNVVSIGSKVAVGLYNPQTTDGNIVVDGIIASTYTTAVEPTFAHAILAPFRFLSRVSGFAFTALESGGGALVSMAPRGALAEL